jgi:hypothetical protein
MRRSVRRAMRAAVVLVQLAACGDGSSARLRVDHAMPNYAPLVGGTLITLHGTGFAPDNRVLIGGREAPLVHAIGTTRLDLVVPPGTQSGDAEVVVFEDAGAATARDIFHYSTPPTITSVSPERVVSASDSTVITVRGTGFVEENAGEATLVVGGQVIEATVIDDTTLSFTAPPGPPLKHPDLELVNQRGRTTQPRAFRYAPSESPGLLLFTRWGYAFAYFYDPVANTHVAIPAVEPAQWRMRTVVRDEAGEYWGIDIGNRLGRLDLATQALIAPVQMPDRVPAAAWVDGEMLAIHHPDMKIGTVDPWTGAFAAISTLPVTCCGSFGIAKHGDKLWFTSRKDQVNWDTTVLNSVDRDTGAFGTPVPLTNTPQGFRIEEMRAYNGKLYAVSGYGTLVEIDPATGAVTQVTVAPGGERFSGIEVFE